MNVQSIALKGRAVLFTFGVEGTKLADMCYVEDNKCESFNTINSLDLYALNMNEEVYLVFRDK